MPTRSQVRFIIRFSSLAVICDLWRSNCAAVVIEKHYTAMACDGLNVSISRGGGGGWRRANGVMVWLMNLVIAYLNFLKCNDARTLIGDRCLYAWIASMSYLEGNR